ncbi:MAG TPA: hemerythrin [Bacteroidales bacterium]|nr:hemerythrin [Bacteroidales bacterium]
MSFFKWEKTYAFGIEAIDKDHQMLVMIINELYEAMESGNSKKILNDIVYRLTDYAKNHFRREEMILKSIAYHEYDSHKAEHNDFINQVVVFKQKLDSGEIAFSVEVARFLREWLKEHILSSDKKYVPEMKKFNVK